MKNLAQELGTIVGCGRGTPVLNDISVSNGAASQVV
jgi:hypothetical protein